MDVKRIGVFFFIVFIFNQLPVLSQDKEALWKSDSTNITEEDTVIIYKEPLIIKKQVYFYNEAKEKPAWSVELFVSPLITKNKFKNLQQEGNNLISSHSLPGYAAGIGVNRAQRGVILSGGISFSSYREKNSYKEKDLTIHKIDYQDTLDTYYVSNNGEVTTVYILDEKKTRNDTAFVFYNRSLKSIYKYLDVFFVAGYCFYWKNISMTFKAGPVGSLLISKTNRGDAQTIREESSALSSFTYGLLVSTGVEFKITEKIGVKLEPFVRKDFNTVMKNKFFEQKRSSVGIRSSIVFNF